MNLNSMHGMLGTSGRIALFDSKTYRSSKVYFNEKSTYFLKNNSYRSSYINQFARMLTVKLNVS